MKIGVVSDTHSRAIPKQLLNDFKKVDLIIHAGDFCTQKDLEIFKKIGNVKAAYGNMDEPPLRKILPRRDILTLESFRIALFHGEGARQTILKTVETEFSKEKVDCIVFGHSHQAFNEKRGPILFFNPGSPNDTVSAAYCSYGILELSEKNIEGRIIKVI